jgi:hypothetical protein
MIKRHYSGEHSKPFWNKINKVKDQKIHDRLYSKGVKLQNLEEIILAELEKK